MPEKRYLTFNKYLKDKYGVRVQRLPLNAGFSCPNRDGKLSFAGCIFCDETGSGVFSPCMPIDQQLAISIERAVKRYKAQKFMVYFQAFTNTYANVDILRNLYDRALNYDERIVGLIVGTRPDCVPEEILELLASYKSRFEVWVEYGLQSAHFRTLRFINRGHGLAEFVDAVLRSKKKGIKVCSHVILGLPGEDIVDMYETARFISALGIDGVKIHMLHVLKGTRLEQMYNSGDIRLMSMDEYVEAVVGFIRHLSRNVVIQRLTGEAPSDRLVAPLWCLDKHKVIKAIDQKFESINAWQGDLYTLNYI